MGKMTGNEVFSP